jgi:phage FluMu gp28-like protein
MSDRLRDDLPAAGAAEIPAALLPYQQAWVADDAPLKVAEKSRRIGLTWAEASDDVLIAAADAQSDGQNVYYIGYNQDMAIEYVEACAMWARAFDYAASQIEEGLWDDGDDDKHIKTFTIRFPSSGHRVVALSSRPANLRGKQGVVVIDEAAFHDQLDQLLKAALALLIWGGRVRVLSTHNGDQNAFNELIQEIRAGKRRGSVQRTTFREAVAQGLYRRVCLRLGQAWTQAGEDTWVQDVYAFYGEDAAEELDVVPSQGSGRYLTRALVESTAQGEAPLLRLALPSSFAQLAQHLREAEARDWCEAELAPLLAGLDPNLASYFGEDFARSGDVTVVWPAQQQGDLSLRTPFVLELRNVPYEQQKQVLFYLVDRLPRFTAGALDATGNGGYLAEVAMQRYGATRIAEIKITAEWYRQHMPRFKAAFEDRTHTIPKHADVVADMLAVRVRKGVAQVPDDARTKGTDGFERHGDSAIALALLHYAVAEMEPVPIEFQSTGRRRAALDAYDETGAHARRLREDVGFGTVAGDTDFGGL